MSLRFLLAGLSVFFMCGFLAAQEAPQTSTESSMSDTSIMGENTPGYNREKSVRDDKIQEQQVKKEREKLLKEINESKNKNDKSKPN